MTALALGLSVSPLARPVRAAATSGDPARVRVSASLVDEVVRGLLPVDIVLPAAIGLVDGGTPPAPTAVALTELRYCGVTERGHGRFRAVIRPVASMPSGAPAPILGGQGGQDSCRLDLTDLTRQLGDRAVRDQVILADLEAVWRPWDLRLMVLRLASPPPARPGEPRPLAALESRRELLLVSTANLRLATETAGTLTVHVAPAFVADAVELVAVLSENGGVPATTRLGPTGQPPALAGGMNVSADLPHSLSNQLLRQLTSGRPLAFPVEREVIDVQNVTISGTAGGLTLIGLATPRSLGESVRLTVQVGGEEARVLSIRAEPQLETCAGLGTLSAIGCNARNAARGAGAAALAALLNQKYQGQAVRELAGAQAVRFEVGGRRLELSGELLHLVSGTRSLTAAGRFALGRIGY